MTLHLELNGCQAIRLMLDENVIQEKMLTGGKETLDLEFPYPETEKGSFLVFGEKDRCRERDRIGEREKRGDRISRKVQLPKR